MRNPLVFENLAVVLQSPAGEIHKFAGEYMTKITLRDLAAIAAMQGMLANSHDAPEGLEGEKIGLSDHAATYAATAVDLADALLAELEKE